MSHDHPRPPFPDDAQPEENAPVIFTSDAAAGGIIGHAMPPRGGEAAAA